jgi:hypothetical protein
MIPEGLVQGPTGPRGATQKNKAKVLDKQSRGVRHTSIHHTALVYLTGAGKKQAAFFLSFDSKKSE